MKNEFNIGDSVAIVSHNSFEGIYENFDIGSKAFIRTLSASVENAYSLTHPKHKYRSNIFLMERSIASTRMVLIEKHLQID